MVSGTFPGQSMTCSWRGKCHRGPVPTKSKSEDNVLPKQNSLHTHLGSGSRELGLTGVMAPLPNPSPPQNGGISARVIFFEARALVNSSHWICGVFVCFREFKEID